MTEKEEIQLKL